MDDDGKAIDGSSLGISLIFGHGQKYFSFFALNHNNSNNKKMNVKKREEIVSELFHRHLSVQTEF